jgi:type II secretion system protein N
MSKTKKRLLYSAYIISVTVFFLYYLFPSEDAKEYILFYANKAVPDVKVAVKNVEPAFPPGLLLRQVTIYYQGKPVMESEKLKVVPGILSLLKRELSVYFKSSLYSGVVKGRFNVPLTKSNRLFVTADIEDIQLSSMMPMIKELIPHKLTGDLKGAITYEREENSRHASAESDLQLVDCGIEFASPLYGVDSIRFKEIDAGFVLKGSRLKVERVTGNGDDMDADISGSIVIMNKMDKSILNIDGDISPHPSLLGKMGNTAHINSFIKSKSGENGIGFRIRGTPANPRFSLK